MNYAIITKTTPATVKHSQRVFARCGVKSLHHNWDFSVGELENHRRAADSLKYVVGLQGEFFAGVLPNGDLVWVVV